MAHVEHPHRFLEFAPTSRGSCSGHCRKPIRQGELKYGTKTHVMDHDSVSWRCLACVTHRQAENIRSDAAKEGKSVHDFLVVPPTDADGPSEEVVNLFVQYLEALHTENEEKSKELLAKLKKFHKTVEDGGNEDGEDNNREKTTGGRKKKGSSGGGSKKRGRKAAAPPKKKEPVDLHQIDEQMREDPQMAKLFAKADLVSLCKHHQLDSEGTKPILVERLEHFYNLKKNKAQ